MEGVFQYYLELLFWKIKKKQKKKKNFKKTLKKQGFPLKKTQFVTDFQYLWRFRNVGSLEKLFFK